MCRNKREETRLRGNTGRRRSMGKKKNSERGAVAEARPERDGEDRKEV